MSLQEALAKKNAELEKKLSEQTEVYNALLKAITRSITKS